MVETKLNAVLKCPHCGREYVPTFETHELASIYGTSMDVEQWISGMCSDACWDELFLGPES